MGLFNFWHRLFGEKKQKNKDAAVSSADFPISRPDPASTRAKEMLEKIRCGKYEFFAAEISEILHEKKWLGSWQRFFVSLEAKTDNQIELYWRVPVLGKICTSLDILDVWHDQRVSSIDFQIIRISVMRMRKSFFKKSVECAFAYVVHTWLQWKGVWRHEALRIVPRANKTLRLYVEWTAKQSPLLKNISVIGTRIQPDSILLYIFRKPLENLPIPAIGMHDEELPDPGSQVLARIAVAVSWLLLGAYAFVLIHVTLPVLGGAFRVMPQSADSWDHFLLVGGYNLCVILLSYFFLRITMLPLYLKWNNSKKELAILVSIEERDHQYLRLLTEFVKRMQQADSAADAGKIRTGKQSAPVENIAQMIELMSRVRAQSRERLFGMTRMRRGWLQELVIGYIAIFFLEWLYYKGLLTPLPESIEWVNTMMARLFL